MNSTRKRVLIMFASCKLKWNTILVVIIIFIITFQSHTVYYSEYS